MKRFLLLLLPCILAAQTATTPGGIPTDADMLVAIDRASTTLSAGIDSSTLTIPVASGAVLPLTAGQTTIVTIESEQILICSRSGNTLTACTGGRGFGGTTAASHSSGRDVRGQISAYYHNRVREEIQALAAAVADNRAYNFSLTSSMYSGDLSTSGAKTITIAAPYTCPTGFAVGNYARISGGVGTAETVTRTGGTCADGTTGTIIFTTSNTHSGSTISSGTAGIQEAWEAGMLDVRMYSGSFTVYGTLEPPSNASLTCSARGRQYDGATVLNYLPTNTKMFNVVNANFKIEGCDLIGPSVPASGSIGIYTAGSGSAVVGATANDVLVSDVRIVRFYDGLYCAGSGGSVDLVRIEASNNSRDGLVGMGCQGYWNTVISEANTRHGIELGLCASGSCGVGPFMSSVQTYNNGGWGIHSLTNIFLTGNNFLNNDYEGEIYQLLHYTLAADNGYIENVTTQFAGLTVSFGTNTDAPGILLDTDTGPMHINNIRCYAVEGNCVTAKSANNNIHNVNVVGAGVGAVAGNTYGIETVGINNHIFGYQGNAPVKLSGGNTKMTGSRVSTSSASIPSLYLASGENFFIDGNFLSNGAGVALESASGVTMLDGENEISGTVTRGGTRSTLAAETNPFLPWLKGALPTIASATTIAPATALAKISGVATIETITAPSGYDGTVFCAIPTGLWSTATGSNIAKATTAVPNQMVCWAYNSTDGFWYPSY